MTMVASLWPVLLSGQARRSEIPSGTEIKVRMIDSLSSETAKVGDIFHGTLEQPIVQAGQQIYPKGADVTGTVEAVHASGRLSDPGQLRLVLNTVTSGRAASSISVQPLSITGESHTKSNATKIGGGTALGAVLGGVFGGGKGAAIGAGAGAAAGTGAAAATGKKDARVASEAILTFTASDAPAAVASSAPAEPLAPSAAEKTLGEEAPVAESHPESAKSRNSNSFDNAVLFTARDRRVIRNCVQEHVAELSSGTMEKAELPSGSERQVHVGGTLPTELQQKAQSLPLSCEEQLPKLPNDQERVLYSGRVLLLDGYGHILDMFDLEESD
jgi:outer membrane lipoprotein SlyB